MEPMQFEKLWILSNQQNALLDVNRARYHFLSATQFYDKINEPTIPKGDVHGRVKFVEV